MYHAERRSSSTTTIDQSEPDRETSVTLSSYDSDSTSAGVETLEALGYASPGTNGLLTSAFYPLYVFWDPRPSPLVPGAKPASSVQTH